MPVALLAALQIVVASPEWVWAEIYIDDTRGGGVRTEVLPKVATVGDRRVLREVVVRRTNLFGGRVMDVRSTDTARCRGLRASLDAIAEVKPFAESTLSRSYEGPTAPPPPPIHRPTATVKLAGMTMTAVPGSALGAWIHRVDETARTCLDEATSPP